MALLNASAAVKCIWARRSSLWSVPSMSIGLPAGSARWRSWLPSEMARKIVVWRGRSVATPFGQGCPARAATFWRMRVRQWAVQGPVLADPAPFPHRMRRMTAIWPARPPKESAPTRAQT